MLKYDRYYGFLRRSIDATATMLQSGNKNTDFPVRVNKRAEYEPVIGLLIMWVVIIILLVHRACIINAHTHGHFPVNSV